MVRTIHSSEFRGRKMKPGKPVADPDLGIMYFICYCDNCNHKVVGTKQYIQRLVKTSHRASAGLRVKIIKLLMATMRIDDKRI